MNFYIALSKIKIVPI